MDWLHRAASGQSLTPTEVRFAGLFALLWFLMDFVQWIDWLLEKLAQNTCP